MSESPNHTFRRGLSLFACFISGLGSGTTYLYSAYAPQLASQLKFSVTQTSTIGLVGSLGTALTGPGSGTLVDKHGPSIAIAIGAALVFFGYNVVQEIYAHEYSSFPVVAGAMLCVGAGSTFVLSAVVKAAAVNYPARQGAATSVPMAAYGLSAFVLSWLAAAIYPGETDGILWILCVVPTVMFFFAYFFVKLLPPDQYEELSNGEQAPVEMVQLQRENTEESAQILHTDLVVETGELSDSNFKDEIDIHGKALLKSFNFWAHCIIMGLLAGMGQMYIYSCGYVVKALITYENLSSSSGTIEEIENLSLLIHQAQSLHVGIISLSSFTGRIFSGSFTDYLVNRLNTTRDWVLLGAGILCLVSQISGLVVTQSSQLWFVSVCTGLMYGMCFGSYPMVIGDAFGMPHFTQNWGVVTIAPIPTAYLFNWLFGWFYDGNTQRDDTGNEQCFLGRKCYGNVYIITTVAALALIAFTAGMIHWNRPKKSMLHAA